MFLRNGLRLQPDVPFVVDGVQYLGVRGLTAADFELLGITEVPDNVRPSEDLNWVTDNPDGTFTVTPRSAEDLATRAKAKVEAAITAVESQITQRMLRDAAAGTPYPAYLSLVAQIATLRSSIK